MTPITSQLLARIAGEREYAVIVGVAPVLAARLAPAGIDTPLRVAHFLSQTCYESGNFAHLEENLDYSAARIAEVWERLRPRAEALAHNPEALGNAAYANENGNGNEAGGDGFRFRGRGLLQLTGRYNYGWVGEKAGLDLIGDPDLAATPDGAVRCAIAFWLARAINEAADADDSAKVTRLVNGGTDGLSDRLEYKVRALRLLER